MATSLESQLIRGAGQAVAKDPYGIVQRAQEGASQKLIKGVEGITKKIGDIKAAELAEEEKLQKEQDDLVKGYDTVWEEDIVKKFDNDGGLDTKAYSYALNQAKKRKTVHDACPIGPEGEICRKEARMGLKNIAQKYTTASGVLETNVTASKDKKSLSNYNSQTNTGINNKAILAGMTGNNIDERGKNDDEIAWMKDEGIKNCDSDECRAKIKKEINQLEELNDDAVGWNIGGKFYNAEDDKMSNLQMKKAYIVQEHYMDRVKDQKKYSWDKGEKFNMDNSIYAHKSIIEPENIASIYYDDVTGPSGILKENLKDHPILKGIGGKGATYKSLGISGKDLKALDTDPDGIISDDEIAGVIEALADPEHPNYNYKTSEAVAAEYMALNEQKERKRYMEEVHGEGQESSFNVDDYEK